MASHHPRRPTLTSVGWLSAEGTSFTAAKVRAIIVRMGLPLRGLSLSAEIERREGEMTVAEPAHRLDRPLGTLYAWVRYGWLPVRRVGASVSKNAIISLRRSFFRRIGFS